MKFCRWGSNVRDLSYKDDKYGKLHCKGHGQRFVLYKNDLWEKRGYLKINLVNLEIRKANTKQAKHKRSMFWIK